MNCKPGDLAYVVFSRSYADALNAAGIKSRTVGRMKIVRVVRYFADRVRAMGTSLDVHNIWIIDPPIESHLGGMTEYCPDEILRPIRDSDGEDEMLRIAGRPNETPREVIADLAPKQVEHSR